MSLNELAPKRQLLRRRRVDHERRLHRRVAWSTGVRGLTDDGIEFDARTIDICAGGLRVKVDAQLQVGEHLVLYLQDIGRVEGSVVRSLGENEYAIVLQTPRRKREKIADQLTWLINREALQLEEDRVAERRASSGEVSVSFGPGTRIECSVIDMSVFGVALRTSGPRPHIGAEVKVSERTGKCVRVFDGGFAVDFRKDAPASAAN